MNVQPTAIAGVVVADTKSHTDPRGSFARWFCAHELAPLLGDRRIVQINHSRTATVGAVRGLHYQHPPYAELKLIRCLRGRIWDVAVDLRADSSTFLRWHAEALTPVGARMIVIPEGCAHGFQVLEPDTELLYLHTAFYTPNAEGGLRYDDPRLDIRWPLPVTDLSDRDCNHSLIDADFDGIAQ